jgi:hypothetical protein
MRQGGDGVQFFGLAEAHWKSDYDIAGTAAASSGYTAGATTATSTAARRAATVAGRGQPARRVDGTGPATRDAPITATTSAPTAPASGSAAWGIMVPKS